MPRHADALYNLGVACAEDGQTERALFCYELTTHFNPNCAEAWNNLGVLHKEADNLERAAECYMAALNIRPNFPQVRKVLALRCAPFYVQGDDLLQAHAWPVAAACDAVGCYRIVAAVQDSCSQQQQQQGLC
jgi:tetratricopeptide (TPR) repeat protein